MDHLTMAAPEPLDEVLAACRCRLEGEGTDNERLVPNKTDRNLDTLLRLDPRWRHRIQWNELAERVELDGEKMTEHQNREIALWYSAVYHFDWNYSRWEEAIRVAAQFSPYNPLQDYLKGLEWDRVHRLDTWVYRLLSAPDHPLYGQFGALALLGAVWRAFEPGSKVDSALVLVGEQGDAKSRAIEYLSPRGEWYADTPFDMRDKDSMISLRGKWLYELSELDAVYRAKSATLYKSFLSRKVDNYRKPYGRGNEDYPRRNVFIGTTNQPSFLNDPTGNRRFWPLRVGKIDLDGIRDERNQLWAEAVHRYHRGDLPMLSRSDEDERKQDEAQFTALDPWYGPIEEYLRGRGSQSVQVSEVLERVIKVPLERQTRKEVSRVGLIFASLGWERYSPRVGGRRIRAWRKRATATP